MEHTLEELEALPTLCVSQADDLKIANGNTRIWLSRCGLVDGEPCNNKVTVEVWDDDSSRWSEQHTYEAR